MGGMFKDFFTKLIDVAVTLLVVGMISAFVIGILVGRTCDSWPSVSVTWRDGGN